MTSRRLAILIAAASLVVLVPPGSAAPSLVRGQVGPYRTIQLKDASGGDASKLNAGTFKFVIQDRSNEHDFAPKGPGVNRTLTGIAATGTKTATVKLRTGVYTYSCSPHSRQMRGTFRVA